MSSHPIHLYNSMTQKKEEFIPLKENQVTMYVCGVTVYDHAHIGHARAAVIFDVIYRYLKYRGFMVTYVRNFTDVDDKIINRANQEGVSWKKSREPIFAITLLTLKRSAMNRPRMNRWPRNISRI